MDIPYKLTGFCGKVGEAQEQGDSSPVEGTQCAHLVWLAYRHFGYDLDSDGGYIVTPYDIYSSEFLELVQIYGISP